MNMVKDLDLAMDTACRNGLTLPLTAAAQAVYKASDSFGLS
jgi:3-hydroxyisobutyrate dehydrogenase-like beta-hydroxyacid dehydrogenase